MESYIKDFYQNIGKADILVHGTIKENRVKNIVEKFLNLVQIANPNNKITQE